MLFHRNKAPWCCAQFSDAVRHPPSREGLSIIPVLGRDPKSERVHFALTFRSVSQGDEAAIAATRGVAEGRLLLRFQQFILHCPWCGVNLAGFYSRRREWRRDVVAFQYGTGSDGFGADMGGDAATSEASAEDQGDSTSQA